MDGQKYIDNIANKVYKSVKLFASTPKPQKETSDVKKSKSSDKPNKRKSK